MQAPTFTSDALTSMKALTVMLASSSSDNVAVTATMVLLARVALALSGVGETVFLTSMAKIQGSALTLTSYLSMLTRIVVFTVFLEIFS
ncbi:hypothetical protein NDU88_000287 [Pleurodeles waltl]|uniref:Uncharacterized protein n=1 Tax=Pleurodeles waltl TaxID=8319 RepID=A0AAV7LCJ4_PLEWA|nr:hypothetical protein NDU88_000287 [Pleurodeles waltl]